MNENTITLNQCNIIGQKIDVDINKIRNNEKNIVFSIFARCWRN